MNHLKRFVSKRGLALVLSSLLLFSACAATKKTALPPHPINVGFDCDDTLLFSTPAFEIATESGAEEYSDAWWSIVNSSDEGNSIIKKEAQKIVEKHQKRGDKLIVITARSNNGGGILKNYLNKTFGINQEDVYFTHRKAAKIRELDIKIFYGDSDSDIEEAMKAGARGIRILRSPKSSYKSKYNPGKYKEEIIPNSED